MKKLFLAGLAGFVLAKLTNRPWASAPPLEGIDKVLARGTLFISEAQMARRTAEYTVGWDKKAKDFEVTLNGLRAVEAVRGG